MMTMFRNITSPPWITGKKRATCDFAWKEASGGIANVRAKLRYRQSKKAAAPVAIPV
jgi:hypothetical protein